MTVKEYILENWEFTIKTNRADKGTLIGLPYPYTTPCKENHFQELYYWDTYFTNRGLIKSGMLSVAEDNVKNFIYLINRFGFIPNGTRTSYLTRSQPPFFGLMLKDVLAVTKDETLKIEGYKALVKEVSFWNERRKSENGLNCYGSDLDDNISYIEDLEWYKDRTGTNPQGTEKACVLNALSECESGWDYNPRFYGKCHEYNPVDLNSLLWFDEWYLGELEKELGINDGNAWKENAEKRKKLMIKLMQADDGIFYDYSYTENKKSDIKSCASFYPYFVGMVKGEKETIEALLSALELPNGVQSTSDNYEIGSYQWGKINCWGGLQLIVVEGLQKCEMIEESNRIAQKYLKTVEKVFERTGKLWEKYNAFSGDIDVVSEYDTPEMMGWTAGVYMALLDK